MGAGGGLDRSIQRGVSVFALLMLGVGVAAAQEEGEEGVVPAADVETEAQPDAVGDEGVPVETLEPTAREMDALTYPVGRILIRFGQGHPELPLVAELEQATFELGRLDDGYVAPGPGVSSERMSLNSFADEAVRTLGSSAINAISAGMVSALNDRGIIGVFVVPDMNDIDAFTGDDLRAADDTDLTLVIYAGVATELRTIASGVRIPRDARIDNPKHDWIRRRSPVQPSTDDTQGDLIRKDELDRYIFRLNRHPGRRVDLAVAPSTDTDGASLDFLVRENRPWTVYAQVSNTGTEQTSEWRERFGLLHTQLTGRDDVLTLDYITAGFQDTNAIIGSYEAPFVRAGPLRWRVFGDASQFTASDVGSAGENFDGDVWNVGGELIGNVYQNGDFFVDVFAGARFERARTSNNTVDVSGQDNLFLPLVGVRAERLRETSRLSASLALEWSLPQVAGTSFDELERMGRLDPDTNWMTLKWDVLGTFFIEPLVFSSWKDPDTPATSTLAHEIMLRTRGQLTNGRLIPVEQQVAGGLYTVRGYPESVTAGDTVALATAEYRFHVPRGLPVDREPMTMFGAPFRVSPQEVYGRPDWDLILRGFVDGALVYNTDEKVFEDNEQMLSTGIGVELTLRRNASIRVDWGIVLSGLESGESEPGDNRLHFVATLLY